MERFNWAFAVKVSMEKAIVGKIVRILKRHGITRAAVFGSFARGEGKKGSDIDLVIEPPGKFTLFDAVRIKGELEGSLEKEVDIITFDSISPHLKAYITRDMKVII